MDGFAVFKFYLATKLHFTTDYDAIKSKGRVKVSPESYENRNDKGLFEKLSRQFETERKLIEYFIANFAYGHGEALYEPDKAEENYKLYLKRKESLTQTFDNDVSRMILEHENSPGSLMVGDEHTWPKLFYLLITNQISLESVVILNSLYDFLPDWEKINLFRLCYSATLKQIRKYTPFLKFDKVKYQNLFLKKTSDADLIL